ncbi:MAG: C40 family peptidase [Acidiferrobacter sp.]
MLRRWFSQTVITWLNHESPAPPRPDALTDPAALRALVRPGDVLLVEGMTRVGAIIKTVSHSPWSHAALCVGPLPLERRSPGDGLAGPVVLEVLLGEGTVLKPLSLYAHSHVRLCRPRDITAADAAAVVAYALARVGTDYDLHALIDLGRLMLPWPIVPARFRARLFAVRAGPHTRTICSTLIAEAYQSVGFPVRPIRVTTADGGHWYRGRSRLVMPKDFDLSPFFDVIKVVPSDYPGYQQVRWAPTDVP